MESIPSKSGDDHLVIICPKCTERFQVDKSFKGRIAECGECRHEFPINESVIEKQRKFYPGEKHDPLLKNVNRVSTPLPQASDPHVPDSFASQSQPVVIGPPSPQRILLAVLSVFIVLITGLMLGFGREPGGVLDGMSIFNQFIMAGFVTVMATGMLIFAGPRFRLRMVLVGLAMGSMLFVIPLVAWMAQPDEEGTTPTLTRPVVSENPPEDENLSVEELRYLIMTKPLDDERERLRKANSTKQAAGLWLRNLYIRNSLLVKDYIIRESKASLQSHPYPRGDHDYLMVVTGIDCGLDELATIAGALGKEVKIHRELGIIEVKVENKRFEAGPIEQMTDPTSPYFYSLNRIELESIDTQRISAAVRRLAPAEPKLFQPDISKRLRDLLDKDWVEDKAEVCKALMTWADPADKQVGAAALRQATLLLQANKEVPVEMVALAVRQQAEGTIVLVDALWLKDQSKWENWYVQCGPLGEEPMIKRFPTLEGSIRHSAVRILGRIGGEASKAVIAAELKDTKDAEMKVLARKALEQIEGRK